MTPCPCVPMREIDGRSPLPGALWQERDQMQTDIPAKVARLIGDFWAVSELANYIQHELEKRIVARLGLFKIDALSNLLPVYKNDLRSRYRGHGRIGELQSLVDQLRVDHDTGIRATRHSLAGHSLHLAPEQIGEGWLFLKKSSYGILSEDLREIDRVLLCIDATDYPGAEAAPPIPGNLRSYWSQPELLGDPEQVRHVLVYAGIWSPGVSSIVPGNTTVQDVTLRVAGLMTYLLQVERLTVPIPFHFRPPIYRRLLYELLVSDLVALEETVYHGPPSNRYGPTTTSMLDEWRQGFQNHQGVDELLNYRALFPVEFLTWKEDVRNKIIAHVDGGIPIECMEMNNWPINLRQFVDFVESFRIAIFDASRHDIATRALFIPPTPMNNVLGLARNDDPLLWDDLG